MTPRTIVSAVYAMRSKVLGRQNWVRSGVGTASYTSESGTKDTTRSSAVGYLLLICVNMHAEVRRNNFLIDIQCGDRARRPAAGKGDR